jgi:hypothetical protein
MDNILLQIALSPADNAIDHTEASPSVSGLGLSNSPSGELATDGILMSRITDRKATKTACRTWFVPSPQTIHTVNSSTTFLVADEKSDAMVPNLSVAIARSIIKTAITISYPSAEAVIESLAVARLS